MLAQYRLSQTSMYKGSKLEPFTCVLFYTGFLYSWHKNCGNCIVGFDLLFKNSSFGRPNISVDGGSPDDVYSKMFIFLIGS